MTDADLDAIERLAAALAPGQWRAVDLHDDSWDVYNDDASTAITTGSTSNAELGAMRGADARFIAAARDFVPAAIAEIRRLRAALDDLHETIDGDMPWIACQDVRRALTEAQDKLCAENAQLRRFAIHDDICRYGHGHEPCTCGLAALLPDGGGQVWPFPAKRRQDR
jgi:hypothetical protein